jgi:hypothetical protein
MNLHDNGNKYFLNYYPWNFEVNFNQVSYYTLVNYVMFGNLVLSPLFTNPHFILIVFCVSFMFLS